MNKQLSGVVLISLCSFIACFESPKANETIKDVIKIQKSFPEKIIDIKLPENFKRIEVEPNSFGAYLRNLKLKKDKTVYAYDGSVVMDSSFGYQYAVIDMDIGNKNLQQCADAVMRLRAEYLYSLKEYDRIHFNFYDGKPHRFMDYSKDTSYKQFRKYMDYIFTYANTATLKKEMHKADISQMQIGDVFIRQGSPFGHAVIVVDMAENPVSGEKIFIVAQSFMPAQSIHILKNPEKKNSPWFSLNFGNELVLPSWTFTKNDLRRF